MINQKYKNMYNGFVKHYRKVHVNPWHEISEYDLEKIYDNLTTSIDVIDEYTFKYFMNYIIKRLSGINDAHTKYEPVSLIPINFKIFGSEILINYPQSLKNNKLIAINGIKIGIIIQELEDVIIYGTPGKRKYELEKALFNRYTLFGLPSLRKFDELIFEIEDSTGQIIRKIFAKKDHYSKEELFDYDEYRYGQNATYSFIDNVLIYNHSSVQMRFKDKIEQAINNLRK